MTYTATKIDQAIDDLLSMWTTALAGTGVVPMDGALPTSAFPDQWLVVGGDGGVTEEDDVASSEQTWAGVGARTRNEVVTVTCACGVSSGSASDAGSFKIVRQQVKTLFALVVGALRADPGLGSTTEGGAQVASLQLKHGGDGSGVAAAFVFTVTVPYRLETS